MNVAGLSKKLSPKSSAAHQRKGKLSPCSHSTLPHARLPSRSRSRCHSCARGARRLLRTWWNVVADFDGDVLGDFELVDCFEDGEALSDRVDPHILEPLVVEVDENLARDAMLCPQKVSIKLLFAVRCPDSRTFELSVVPGEPERSEELRDSVLVQAVEITDRRGGVFLHLGPRRTRTPLLSPLPSTPPNNLLGAQPRRGRNMVQNPPALAQFSFLAWPASSRPLPRIPLSDTQHTASLVLAYNSRAAVIRFGTPSSTDEGCLVTLDAFDAEKVLRRGSSLSKSSRNEFGKVVAHLSKEELAKTRMGGHALGKSELGMGAVEEESGLDGGKEFDEDIKEEKAALSSLAPPRCDGHRSFGPPRHSEAPC